MNLTGYTEFERNDSASYDYWQINKVLDEIAYFETYSEFVNPEKEKILLFFKFNSDFTPEKEDFTEAIRELGNLNINCTVVSKESDGLYIELHEYTQEIIQTHEYRDNI